MKKFFQLFTVALLSGVITLGGYFLMKRKDNNIPEFSFNNQEAPLYQAALNNRSSSPGEFPSEGFSVAAEKTVNAVVHVKNMTKNSRPSINDFFFGFGSSNTPQVGSGSGVIISSDGYVVTNNHVIENSEGLEITLNNNRTYPAEIIGTDPISDIALLKIDAEDNLPYLAFGDSDNAQVGEWVLAVGNPFNLTSTVTAGIISAKARAINPTKQQSFIQTDAAVNPGNSGGALVNTRGELIGINTAITSQTGSYVGYSFAVPSNIAKKVVNDLLEFGSVQKGILGIQTIAKGSAYARENNLDELDGIFIAEVVEKSGASEAGLQSGDIIKSVDQVKTSKFSELTGYLTSKRPGDKVVLTIEREGKILEIPVKLTKKTSEQLPIMNWEVDELTEKDKKTYNIKEGVKIINVPEYYRESGLQNKVLIAVDGEPIKDLEDAREKFSRISRYGSTTVLLVDENGNRERIVFR